MNKIKEIIYICNKMIESFYFVKDLSYFSVTAAIMKDKPNMLDYIVTDFHFFGGINNVIIFHSFHFCEKEIFSRLNFRRH